MQCGWKRPHCIVFNPMKPISGNARILLAASLLVNLLFAGILVFKLSGGEPATIEMKQSTLSSAIASATLAKMPFQWAQVESDDYPTYIANLRSIGCPEQTIRDLVTVEINRYYQQKQLALQPRAGAQGDLAIEKKKLVAEQQQLFQQLFPPANETPDISVSSHPEIAQDTAATAEEQPLPPEPVCVPLALIDPDTSMPMDETQLGAFQALQDRFVAAVGGENQNPADPLYRERWIKAQADMDEALHSLLGDDAFNALLLKRQMSAQAR